MLGHALLLASPTQVCHVFVGMAAFAHLVLAVTGLLRGMHGFGFFADGGQCGQEEVGDLLTWWRCLFSGA
jgi:hypothetical protein